MKSRGIGTAADSQKSIHQQLLRAQAQASAYKAILEREQETSIDNARLVDALSLPGARLIAMKGIDGAAHAVAYALLVENSRLVFVASNLPQLPEGRQFQLWLLRKDEPRVVSAGAFTPDTANRSTVYFDDASLVSEISLLAVTEEPEGGSSAPTGTRILEAQPRGADNTD